MVATEPATEIPAATPGPKHEDGAPFALNVAILVSILIHILGLVVLAMVAFLKPHKPSTVPVFELVNLEQPKLRPIEPKQIQPPEPPPPEPEPVKAPEAPKLTPKPTKAPTVKKPEPKVVKPPDPDAKVEKEVVHEQQVLQNKVEMNIPSDPRLSFWASRVKKKVDNLWQAPHGLDVVGSVKTVVNFKVSRDGTILSQEVSQSSGNSELDELALMTIRRLGNVPPIPDNFPGDELEVGCELTYQGN